MKKKWLKKNALWIGIPLLLLLVILVSWLAFPAWRTTPGGKWTLLSIALLGVLGLIKDVVSIVKDYREIQKGKRSPASTGGKRTQTQRWVEDSEQDIEGQGSASQLQEHVKNGKQHIH